jgi:hypothetical protein
MHEVMLQEQRVLQVCGLLALLGDNDFDFKPSPLDAVFNRPFPAVAVSMSCGFAMDEIWQRNQPLSAAGNLYDALAAVNPSLTAALERLTVIGCGAVKSAANRSVKQSVS